MTRARPSRPAPPPTRITPNDTTVYLCVYEKVRTQAAMATLDYDGNILGIGGGIGEKKYDLASTARLRRTRPVLR